MNEQIRHLADAVVARAQATSGAPSIVAAVVHDGAVVHVSAAGQAIGEVRETQFRLGSITKTLTAALVLGLRDKGRLDLDDHVSAHLPGLDLPGVRVRHLLGHASGLQREPDGRWWERNPGGTLDDLIARVSRAKLAFGPYQQFHYSNVAYGLLGGIVARLTVGTWWDAVRAKLIEPLGMARTTYHPTEPYARGYVVHPWDGTLREEPREDAGAMAPAGQLWSTVDGLATLAAALGGSHPDVLAPSTVDEMARPVIIADPDAWTNGYGLGLQLWRSGNRVYIGHTGSMPGYLAVVVVHRPSGTAVVAFASAYTLPGTGIGRLGSTILDAVLDSRPRGQGVPAETVRPAPPAPAPAAPPEVAALLGTWWWMGRRHEVRWQQDTLVVAGPSEEWSFTAEGPDRWRGRTGEQAGEILSVLRGPSGEVEALDIATFVFRRTPMVD